MTASSVSMRRAARTPLSTTIWSEGPVGVPQSTIRVPETKRLTRCLSTVLVVVNKRAEATDRVAPRAFDGEVVDDRGDGLVLDLFDETLIAGRVEDITCAEVERVDPAA
ncbi:MAG: hypothetical protein AAGA54_11310 [Myxococcota bacterium]